MSDTDDDTDILARTLYGEARGEGATGMTAVACVIVNRRARAEAYIAEHGKDHPLYGDGSAASACQADYQFSCWNDDDPNLDKIETVTFSDPQFLAACHIAEQAVAGKLGDVTRGATHYYANGSPVPAWARGKTPCAVIGHHLFFNDIDNPPPAEEPATHNID